jgi:hypothetical protein
VTADEEEALRGLLRGHQLVFPVMVFGMLGGDPNDFTTEEYVRIVGWLVALGYQRRVRPRFRHATMMAIWVREEAWPGETPADRKPYTGIMLRADPELIPTRAELAERNREWHRRLSQFR